MGIFNEIEILNQIGLEERDDLKELVSENIKIKSIEFDKKHNFYNVEMELIDNFNFYELKRNTIKDKRMFIPGDKNLVKERKSKFLKERKIQGYESYCHRGHLIGVQFKNYIEYDDFNFSKNNPENIYPQCINANLDNYNNSQIFGQAYFENIIKQLLDENKKDFLYNVIPIFNGNKYFPIGNLMIAIEIGVAIEDGTYFIPINKDIKNSKEIKFCVFIPNYLDLKFLSKS